MIAYFSKMGELIVSGRKISFNQAPRLVQDGLERIKKSHENKNGKLSVIHVYELNEDGEIGYYVNMGNSNLYLAVKSDNRGSCRIIKKVNSENGKLSAPTVVSF